MSRRRLSIASPKDGVLTTAPAMAHLQLKRQFSGQAFTHLLEIGKEDLGEQLFKHDTPIAIFIINE